MRFKKIFNKTQDEEKIFLRACIKGHYTKNADGSIDVTGDVKIFGYKQKKLPVRFRHVSGNFDCTHNQLTSLAEAPKSVGGNFYCINNQLTSLAGAPKSVGGNFNCSSNQLTSLAGAPESVGENFWCINNQLTSLTGAPKSVGGHFDCIHNQLTSLDGAPKSVGGNFYCYNNQLTSLAGAPKSVGGNFWCTNNQLTSLTGAPESVGGDFDSTYNKLTSLTGAPKSVGGNFYCYNNQLTSLTGAPKSVGRNFNCSRNQLTTLTGAPESVGGDFDCTYNQLTSLAGAPEKLKGKLIHDPLIDSFSTTTKQIKNTLNPYDANKNLRMIRNETLYFVADHLLKNHTIDEKILIKDIKKEMNININFGGKFNRPIMKEFIKLHSNGFSVQDIINFDKQVKVEEISNISKLNYGIDIKLGMSEWTSSIQRIFQNKTNHVLQLNYVGDIDDILTVNQKHTVSDETRSVETTHKNNIEHYTQNSNHPTSRKYLTLAWCRFTVFPKEEYVVLDEIQTDMDDKEFLGSDFMKGWDTIMMRYFIDYIRHKLHYRKILLPTYDAKQNLYNANPPMYLHKELPNKFGFKKPKTSIVLDGKDMTDDFLVLERFNTFGQLFFEDQLGVQESVSSTN